MTGDMGDPIELDAASFFDFISTPGPVVLYLSFHPALPFNRALPRRVREEGSDVPFGTVKLLDLVTSASPALPFLQRGLSSCGVQAPFDVLPGYYLFHDGHMLAWDLGLPIGDDVHAIARGSVLGIVAFMFTQDVAILGKTLRMATDEATAARLTSRFRDVFDDRGAAASPPRPTRDDDLARAYRTLGVPPTAADQEVEAAWRKLRVKFHPDRAAADPGEFQRRSRLAAELNWARDVIRQLRSRRAS
jgi:hypothetical protein